MMRLAAVGLRRLGVLLAGLAVCAAGVAMLVLPGPGLLVIAAGLALLSVEFTWARRLLQRSRAELGRRVRGRAPVALPRPAAPEAHVERSRAPAA